MSCRICVAERVCRSASCARMLGKHTKPEENSLWQRASVSTQKIGSVHSRGWLQELPRLLCGPADRPGHCPLVPATTSEAELRTAVAMATLFLLRVVHPWDLELLKCFHSHIWTMGMENLDHALF